MSVFITYFENNSQFIYDTLPTSVGCQLLLIVFCQDALAWYAGVEGHDEGQTDFRCSVFIGSVLDVQADLQVAADQYSVRHFQLKQDVLVMVHFDVFSPGASSECIMNSLPFLLCTCQVHPQT